MTDRITQLDVVTRAMFLATKAMDTTRPVLDASGYSHRVPETDVWDSHDYEQDPAKFAHWDLGLDVTEAWGVNVGENPALEKLVNLALYRSREDPQDNRWEEAFDSNFKIEEEVNRPAPIAVDQQPAVKEPKVRQWPWERV